MPSKKIDSYILILILGFSLCSSPPKIEPMKQIDSQTPNIVKEKTFSSFKRLDAPSLEMTNSKVIMNFYDDYKTIDHEIILTPKNLADYSYYPSWSFNIDSNGATIEENTCQIKTNGELSDKKCTISVSENEGSKSFNFKYEFLLYNNDQAIIKYRIKYVASTRQILYHQEAIVIPLIIGATFCDYKFIIPDEYTNLGLANNMLTKESDTIYTYNGECPTDSGGLKEIIRFTPEQSLWKANMGIYLDYPNKFTKKVGFKFPRYYIGGKLKNTYHRIISTEGEKYEEKNSINEDQQFQVEVSAANKDKAGALIYTAFTNKLSDDFEVVLNEDLYQIDETKIDPDIKSKAQEIIAENSNFENYIKIGKFVYSHIEYDISYVGRKLGAKEIYEGKKGVCEHYTILYNAMLNAIGIKTLYISGWAFDGDKISGNKDTLTHAWTVALIGTKWIELDATWGLFEGIPAGHIFKNFNNDAYSYYTYEEINQNEIRFYQDPLIQMVTDESELEDPDVNEEIEGDADDKKSEEINSGNNDENNNENHNEDNNMNDGVEGEDIEDESSFEKPSLILSILLLFNFIF